MNEFSMRTMHRFTLGPAAAATLLGLAGGAVVGGVIGHEVSKGNK